MSSTLPKGPFLYRVWVGVIRAKIGCVALFGFFMGTNFLLGYVLDRPPAFDQLDYVENAVVKVVTPWSHMDRDEVLDEVLFRVEGRRGPFHIGPEAAAQLNGQRPLAPMDTLSIWHDQQDPPDVYQLARGDQILISYPQLLVDHDSDKDTPTTLLAIGAILASIVYIRSRIRTRILLETSGDDAPE